MPNIVELPNNHIDPAEYSVWTLQRELLEVMKFSRRELEPHKLSLMRSARFLQALVDEITN